MSTAGPAPAPLLRLLPHHLDDLRRSGLTDETIRRWGCYSIEADQNWVMSRLGFPHLTPPALALPVLTLDLTEPNRNFCIIKPDRRRSDNRGRPVKYESPKNFANRLHLPLSVRDKISDASVPLVISEGQKKGEAAGQRGICAIALFGVNNWLSRVGESSFPIGDFDSIPLKDRRVILCFDSDAADNSHVAAESAIKQTVAEMVTTGALAALTSQHAAGLETPTFPKRMAGRDSFIGRLATSEQAARTAQRYGATLGRPGPGLPAPTEQEPAQPPAPQTPGPPVREPIITPAPPGSVLGQQRALPPAGAPEETDFLAGRPSPTPRLPFLPRLGVVEDVGPGVRAPQPPTRPMVVDASEVSATPPSRLPFLPEPQPINPQEVAELEARMPGRVISENNLPGILRQQAVEANVQAGLRGERGIEAEAIREPYRAQLSKAARQERINQLDAGIAEGETRLRSGVNALGERLTPGELEAVRTSVENARSEREQIGGTAAPGRGQVGGLNLTIQRMANPIEKQFAKDYLAFRQGKGPEPEAPYGLTMGRQQSIQARIDDTLAGKYQQKEPAPETVYKPAVLEDARATMAEAADFLSQMPKPGRYQAVEGEEFTTGERGGKWYGITSLRNQFPWFADLKVSPKQLADAVGRGKGPVYDRLLTAAAEYVDRQREAAAPVIAEFEPELRRLADATRETDPQISQTLTDIAEGRYSSSGRLRALIERTVADARQVAEFSKAVDNLSQTEPGIPEGAPQGVEPGGVSRREEGILPGLEQASVEQARAAGQLRAERLTEETNRPPESIEEQAGRMERESPLFRGTKASPQGELLGKASRLSAGIDPTLLRNLIPESAREYLGREAEATGRARGLQAGLYDLESQNSADLLRARDAIKSAPGTAADQQAIYHHLEDPRIPLTPEQQQILDTAIRPMMEESDRIHQKLTEGGAQVENYVHRIPAGKGSLLERIVGGRGKLGGGSALSTYAASARGRVMMALEDAEGNRRVVAIKGGEVTAFDQGQAESLGKLRGLETQGVKTREQILDREVAPLEREIDRLDAERRTLTATKGRAEASARRIENIENRLAELRQAVADSHLDVPESELQNRVFVDKDGDQWRITQATTREIEANTNLRYYKNALVSATMNYLSLRRAERAYDFLEQYKASPDFQEVAHKVGQGVAPAGWRTTDLPQFRGYVFEPHTAEVLDWYAKRMRGGEGAGIFTKVGRFLRTSIFFNPLIHTPNIAVHWTVEKGVTGFTPEKWPTILRTGAKAINAVIHQNSDFLEALDAGAPLQSQRVGGDNITPLLLEKMGRELQGNPSAAARIANALGYANPARLIRAIYNFSGKVTWVTNDIAMLQAAYEKTDRGIPLREALKETALHIPDYRLPTRILNSTSVAKLMSNPNITMFGAYHYGALRSYGEMAKALVNEHVPLAERARALDRIAMLGLVTYALYPQADKLAKWLTGDPTAQFRRAGASTFVWNLQKLVQGEKTPTDVLESVATPAVHTKSAIELAANRNLYTGRRLYDVHAPAGELARQVGGYLAQTISPIQQASRVAGGQRTPGQFAASLAGIRYPLKTQAEKRLAEYMSEAAGTAPRTAQERAASAEVARLRQGLATGKLSPEDVRQSFTAGKIDLGQARGIVQDARGGPLGSVRHLPLDKALNVWDVATPQERKQIAPLVLEKSRTLGNYEPEQRQVLIDRLRKVLADYQRGTSALPFLQGQTTPQPVPLPFLQQQAAPEPPPLPFLRRAPQ